ncbi:MAG: transposase, partial [Candidatus Electrothrix sp. AR4]|nr:transposase [Candidatus Electrothrix sp. AR4]
GAEKAKRAMARQLLDVLDDVTIAAKTGLALTAVEEIRSDSRR